MLNNKINEICEYLKGTKWQLINFILMTIYIQKTICLFKNGDMFLNIDANSFDYNKFFGI